MKPLRKVLYAGAALLSLAIIGTIAQPRLLATVRAALVEIVVPSNPFFALMTLSGTGSQSCLLYTSPIPRD